MTLSVVSLSLGTSSVFLAPRSLRVHFFLAVLSQLFPSSTTDQAKEGMLVVYLLCHLGLRNAWFKIAPVFIGQKHINFGTLK